MESSTQRSACHPNSFWKLERVLLHTPRNLWSEILFTQMNKEEKLMLHSPTNVPNLVHKQSSICNICYQILQIQLFQFDRQLKWESHFVRLAMPLNKRFVDRKRNYQFTTDRRQQSVVVELVHSVFPICL